ncbi:hypothetical protein AAG570_009700, partial [Ranatra chinensis]
QFWEVICEEHGILPNGRYNGSSRYQLERVNVYFSEGQARTYVPRAVLIDLDRGTLEGVRNGPMGRLFSPDNFISAEKGTGNNWAKGFYTEGPALAEESLEAIRRSVEECDSPQGFHVLQSLGGGTGSGLGCHLLVKLREEFPEKIMNTFTVLPSPETSAVVVEPYNCVFSLNYLVESSDETVCLDNEGLNRICTKTLKIPTPGNSELNHLVSMVMSGVSACMRFPGQLNADLRKLQVNLVPYPRLHFFCPAFVPLTSAASQSYRSDSVSELVRQMVDPKHLMSGCDPRHGKYLAAAALFRGKGISTKEIDTELRKPRGTTAIQEVFRKQVTQHLKMFKKKAFIHTYTLEGMAESEFTEAGTNVNELISEYLQYQEATSDQAGENEDDEDEEVEDVRHPSQGADEDTDEARAGPS